MTRRTIPLTVPGVTEAEVAVGARVVGVERASYIAHHRDWTGATIGQRPYLLVIEEPEPQGQTERRRFKVQSVLPDDEPFTFTGCTFWRAGRCYGVWEERP